MQENVTSSGLHVIAKPIGPACNLKCDYCFYLEKEKMFPERENFRMSDEVLSAFIRQYIDAQPGEEVEFVWQGGEPTMLGIDFFKRVIALQDRYKKDKIIRNCLQTNGVLLDNEWCESLKKNDFLVGISLDGPKDVHDLYRRDREGKGSFDRAMRGLELLKKHNVKFNVLACVAKGSAKMPLEVYQFLKDNGVQYIQFSAVVERESVSPRSKVTQWTVDPESYGDFLIKIFDEWIKNDIGKIFVMNFEWALNAWAGRPSPVCIFAKTCGRSLVIEHNGDVYSCDHYVYPQFKLGNVMETSLNDLAELPVQVSFGEAKSEKLLSSCRLCKYLFACRGECPKRRFARSSYGGEGAIYLCRGYKKFFRHIDKTMNKIREIISQGRPASDIMSAAFKG